ncbi:hypothetical protein Hanom_Chr05g00435971 [Helianthus anomalus]
MEIISSISCLVNIPLPARRSKKREPMAPSTFMTKLFAFERVTRNKARDEIFSCPCGHDCVVSTGYTWPMIST